MNKLVMLVFYIIKLKNKERYGLGKGKLIRYELITASWSDLTLTVTHG